MHPRTRDIEAKDCNECLSLLARRPFFGRYMAEHGLFNLLGEHWKSLLEHSAVSHGVSEDLSEPHGSRIFNWGLIAFVRESWFYRYSQSGKILCVEAVLNDIATGNKEVLLSEKELSTANASSGLIAVNVTCACRPERVFREFDSLHSALDAYLHAIGGFRVREVCMEGAGDDERALFLDNGATKFRSFVNVDGTSDMVASRDRPFLVGLSRDEATKSGHRTAFSAQIFRHRPIRYALSLSQQEFIRLALRFPSDKELINGFAEKGVALKADALGRRWARIFKRVEALQPEDDPVIPPASSVSAKRARILLYFARERHELRPHDHKLGMSQESRTT